MDKLEQDAIRMIIREELERILEKESIGIRKMVYEESLRARQYINPDFIKRGAD